MITRSVRETSFGRSSVARLIGLAAVGGGVCGLWTSSANAQDSVPIVPGGNDAVSAYSSSLQRVRYVVDCVPLASSWGNDFLIAPIIKASRDTDPMFRSQILGSIGASSGLLEGVSFSPRSFSLWTARGQGVEPAANSSPGTISVSGFDTQFGVALADFSVGPTNIVGATVGRDGTNFARLFVQRDVLVCSRTSAAAADLCTLSLGGVSADGGVLLRADDFGTIPPTTDRVRGDNILVANPTSRTAGLVGSLRWALTTNIADDAGALSFVLNNEPTPTNTPAAFRDGAGGHFGLIYDFATRFRAGSSVANTTTVTSHLPTGVDGHRGNPSYTKLNPSGVVSGGAGMIASLAKPTGGGPINAIMAFGLTPGLPGDPPSVTPGSSRLFTLPSSISAPDGFIGNSGGNSAFKQYLSQVSFRGGNGQVGIGQNGAGDLVLAAVATDPAEGDFVAVVQTTGLATSEWTVAGHRGQNVLDGAGGTAIGTIDSPLPEFSAPAVDGLGNVYFLATWRPSGGPVETGLFKAVNLGGALGYQLERVLSTGQSFTGVNSASVYTITALTLRDSDSIASGTLHSGQIIQQQAPAAATTDPTSPRAFGGLVVAASITYDNSGVEEEYDAVLFIGPTGGAQPCVGDFNMSGGVTVQDLFDFLAAWFGGDSRADINGVGGITVQDLFDFLAAWFTPCQ